MPARGFALELLDEVRDANDADLAPRAEPEEVAVARDDDASGSFLCSLEHPIVSWVVVDPLHPSEHD